MAKTNKSAKPTTKKPLEKQLQKKGNKLRKKIDGTQYKNIVFFRISWMKYYRGITENDMPKNGGSWVNEHEDAGEAHNFSGCSGQVYGYVRPDTIDIKRIDPNAKQSVHNTLVIFFSTKPGGGQYIVGWYKNALVFKKNQIIKHSRRPGYTEYNATAKHKDAHLLPIKDRWYELPVRPGQKNVWYGQEYLSKIQLADIIEYVKKPVVYKKKKTSSTGKPVQYDIEKRFAVEHNAMDATWKYYSLNGFKMFDVSGKNLGWDLEAVKGNQRLTIEVKGLSGNDILVELTPNEYNKFLLKRKNFRLAIYTNALKGNGELHLFQFVKEIKKWIDLDENELRIRTVKFARISIK